MISNGNGNGHQNGKGRKVYVNREASGTAVEAGRTEVGKGKNGDAREREGLHERAEDGDFPNDDLLIDDEDLLLDDGDEPASHNLKGEEGKRGRLRRTVTGLVVMFAFLIVFSLVLYFWVFAGRGRSDMSLRVTTPPANASTQSNVTGNDLSAEEIARAMNGNANARQDGATNETTTTPTPTLSGGLPVTSRPPNDSYSMTVPDPLTTQSSQQQLEVGRTAPETVQSPSNASRAAEQTEGARRMQSVLNTGANTERSIRVNPQSPSGGAVEASNERALVSASPEVRRVAEEDVARESRAGVTLPPLGTMLPVRTLGAVYTLRSETLVRMQLTRALEGRGWSLRRGTELYGTVRGSDFEIGRAYVALIGFVDPETNRLVRVQGNVLGGDGAEGLRGRKRQIGGGWSRALRTAGAGALDALSAIAGGFGNRPVIISDVYGANRMSALTSELGGVGFRNNRSGFVEIPAGTAGYVLVMQMPREAEGVDAAEQLARLGAPELQRLADSSTLRTGTQLSDEDLALLITAGTPEQIRNALPRMSPEMRRVAEATLISMASEGRGR